MKKQFAAYALTGVLALGIVGCGGQPAEKKEETKTEEKTEQVQQKETTVSWKDAKDAEEAAKGANMDKFGVPETITIDGKEFKDPKFTYADGVAQATYENGAIGLIVRKGTGKYTAPLTDRDKTEFANKWTKKYEDIDVTLYGAAKGAATVMTWNEGEADYGVTYQGLGGEEVTMDSEESEAVVKAIKEANATEEKEEENKDEEKKEEKKQESSSNNSNNNSNSSSNNSGSSNNSDNGGNTTGNVDGFDVKYTADQAMQIACDYAGAGGQAKGEALNLHYNGPITGGGTVYYKVFFNLGDVAYEVQVDATDGHVFGSSQTFNGVEQLLDEEGNPIDGTEQPAE